MRFDHIILDNFGPHRHCEFSPSPRLTGIIGRNGTGKSTILAALEYSLTGRSPTEGTKDEDVSDFAGPKDVSRIVSELTHGPDKLKLVRGIKHATTSLSINGGKLIEGDSKVNNELARLIGPSASLLSDYVFVKQGLLSEFIAATPAKRAEACARLFNVRRASELNDALGKAMATLEVPAISSEIDTLRRELGDAREALSALKVKLVDYADVVNYDAANDPDALLLAAADKRVRLLAEYRTAGEALTRALDAVAAAESSLEANRRAEEKAGAACEELKASAKEASKSLGALARAKALTRKLADLEHEKKAAPKKPADYADFSEGSDEDRAWCELLEAKNANARLLANLDDAVECPTCGTAIDASGLQERMIAARTDLPGQIAAVNEQSVRRAASLAYDKAWERWTSSMVAWRDRKVELEHEHAEAVADASMRHADCRAAIDTAESAGKELVEISKRLAFGVAEVAGYRREVNGLRKRREGIKAVLPAKVEAATIAEAKQRLAAKSQRLAARGELVGAIKAGSAAIKDRQASLARLEDEQDRGSRIRALRTRMSAMRAVLEFSGLPRQVARANLSPIEGKLNEMLDRFEANFRVASSEDLSFTAQFQKGKYAGVVQPMKRLSKGQKALFALAYRCEVNSRFVGDVGLLCLDEPTDSLDRTNVGCLDVALSAIRDVADSRGLQCWLVTHELSLVSLFDSYVHLE